MAWEMQEHMHEYLAPSIWIAALEREGKATLEYWYVEQRLDIDGERDLAPWAEELKAEAAELDEHTLVGKIADHAEKVGTTQNGAFRFYLAQFQSGYHISIPYCSEEDMLDYSA